MTRPKHPCDFYCPSSYRAEESVGHLMKRIVVSIVSQADKRLDLHGLTSAQWGPLLRLQNAGASTAAELARWLHVDAGAARAAAQCQHQARGDGDGQRRQRRQVAAGTAQHRVDADHIDALQE